MAVLTPIGAAGVELLLRASHDVGRAPGCALCIPDPRVSGQHALIAWRGGRWVLRDRGSRNGTVCGERRLAPGEERVLAVGDRLAFGHADNAWVFTDDAPPTLLLRAPDGTVREAASGVLVLPADDPQLTIFRDQAGRWMVEDTDALWPAASGATVQVEGQTWVIHLPGGLPPTEEAEQVLEQARLHLAVSPDEETVQVEVIAGTRRTVLPPRAHHYLLLTLARQRLADAAEGLAPRDQGWLYQPELCRMLKVRNSYVNVAVSRIRKELAELGLLGAAGIVERRPAARELRIGVAELTVGRLE